MPKTKSPDGGIAVKTRSRTKLKPPSLWRVILHNDDYTTQEFVVFILRAIFRKTDAEAVRIMLDTHQKGKGVAGVYPHEVAESKVLQVKALAEQNEYPLLCTLEPED